MEDFLSIHELSTQFNVSARVIRYTFRRLIQERKLVDGQDYKQVNYRDEFHFEWRIAPLPFMRASGLTLAPVAPQSFPASAATQPVSPSSAVGNQTGSHSSAPVTETGAEPVPVVNQPSTTATQTGGKVDTKPAMLPSFEREMFDLLKSELTAKNGQITELSSQNAKLNDLNKNLVAQTVSLSTRIQELLTLPAAGDGARKRTIKVDEPLATMDNQVGNELSSDGEPRVDDLDNRSGGLVAKGEGAGKVEQPGQSRPPDAWPKII